MQCVLKIKQKGRTNMRPDVATTDEPDMFFSIHDDRVFSKLLPAVSAFFG